MERVFSFFWKTRLEKNQKKVGYLSLEEIELRLQMFMQLSFPGQSIGELGGSLWAVGFIDDDLLLPKDIFWTPDKDLNYQLVLLLVLKSIAIKELQLKLSFHDRARTQPRLYILSKMPQINRWLDQAFPEYQNLEMATIEKFRKYLLKTGAAGSDKFAYWTEQIEARTVVNSSVQAARVDVKTVKRNDEPDVFLHATVPLPFRQGQILAPQDIPNSAQEKDSAAPSTLKKRNQKEFVESADKKNDEELSMVLHSFEKAEAADDYDGGRRVESGDDELQDHQNSLDELELNRSTNAGEASSVYNQDSVVSQFFKPQNSSEVGTKKFLYDEWSTKENRYLQSYCTVIPQIPDESNEDDDYKTKIRTEQRSLILKWKAKMQSLIFKPIWKNRLVDGAELDLDSLVRLLPELKNFSGQPRIYSDKKKMISDVSILILADVSYSTDTWVNGQKVIRVIKDSLSVLSFVFEGLFDNVSVVIANSETRKKINYVQLKNFDEKWSAYFKRSHEIFPKQYTRLGPAIRHATAELRKQNAIKPVLILVTDGKPTDLDPYEGKHGQKDVRKAIEESQSCGISVLTLTISSFDDYTLKKIFDRPRTVANPDDFCRETYEFLSKTCLKK